MAGFLFDIVLVDDLFSKLNALRKTFKLMLAWWSSKRIGLMRYICDDGVQKQIFSYLLTIISYCVKVHFHFSKLVLSLIQYRLGLTSLLRNLCKTPAECVLLTPHEFKYVKNLINSLNHVDMWTCVSYHFALQEFKPPIVETLR